MSVTEKSVLNFKCHCGAWSTGEPIVLVEQWAEPSVFHAGVYHIKEVARFFGAEECKRAYLAQREQPVNAGHQRAG